MSVAERSRVARLRLTLMVGLGMGMSVPLLSHGQGPDPALVLEEVIVTATKREASLQDVAVAVTALDANSIQDAQLQTAEDLTFLVPSLNLQKGSNPGNTCLLYTSDAADE